MFKKRVVVEKGGFEELNTLRPWAEIWGSPGFQDYATGVRTELDALKQVAWSPGGIGNGAGAILATCGLPAPTDRESELNTFMCVKAVVNYVERNLRFVESQSQAYHELLKEIQKREGNENDD